MNLSESMGGRLLQLFQPALQRIVLTEILDQLYGELDSPKEAICTTNSDGSFSCSDRFQNRFAIIDRASPGSAADVLQCGPDASVVGE